MNHKEREESQYTPKKFQKQECAGWDGGMEGGEEGLQGGVQVDGVMNHKERSMQQCDERERRPNFK